MTAGLVLLAVFCVLAVCGWLSIAADLWFRDRDEGRWGDDWRDDYIGGRR